jgi:predicted dehydrogenase
MKRRTFIKGAATAGAGLAATTRVASPLFAFNGSPAEKVVMAVMGLNGRGMVHAEHFAKMANAEVAYLCDVDSTVLGKAMTTTGKLQARAIKAVGDFRRVLDDKSVDAIAIATPDHWHTPMTMLAVSAGKHVYLEKPSGHDAHEDELIIASQKKHNKLVQLGTQRRSGPRLIEAVQMIRAGAIGKVYLGRAWYANTRGTIGKGKPAPVPANLDYELWQGPAPRTPYHDNTIHYNWHWFKVWGTGEICNNGTHEIDVCRWAMGVDYPTRVISTGSRNHFDDDWQFPDSQEATWDFEGGKTIIWQGESCNGLATFGRSRGSYILGTGGSMLIDGDGYIQYDIKGKVVKDMTSRPAVDPLNTLGDDPLTALHQLNFVDAVRTGIPLTAPIADGAKTGLLCHLGTIAQQTGRILHTSPANGHIIGDAAAMALWGRTYQPGWSPVV